MTRSYGTNVDSVELLQMMFYVHRSVTHSEIDVFTATNYIKHIGSIDINLSDPHIFLTFYILDKNGYVAICNNCEIENSVTALLLNEYGKLDNFLDESCDGDFCYIDLSKFLSLSFEDKPEFSDISFSELQKKLKSNYVEVTRFLKGG